MKKVLIIGGGLLVGLITAAIVTIYLSLGSMITDMIETNGTEMLGTAVTVEDVEVRPFDGYLTVRGLKIKNPREFNAESIFTLTEMTVLVDTATLRSDLITIHQLSLVEPRIYYELEFPEGNNLATIGRNIDAYTKKQEGSAQVEDDDMEPAPNAVAPSDSTEPKLVITKFEMLRAELMSGTNVRSPSLQKFPDFHIENVGAETGGATPAEVAGYILGIISKRMVGF